MSEPHDEWERQGKEDMRRLIEKRDQRQRDDRLRHERNYDQMRQVGGVAAGVGIGMLFKGMFTKKNHVETVSQTGCNILGLPPESSWDWNSDQMIDNGCHAKKSSARILRQPLR
jgi:hypothetical protein